MAEQPKKPAMRGNQEGPGEEQRSILSYLNPFHNSVSTSEVLLFTKYFSTLTKAGIPVLRCLATLSRQMKVHRFKSLIWKMRDSVEGGMPLNVSFKENEDIFGLLYVNLIRVGEESGRLFMVLERLNMLLDRQIKLRRKVVAALTYPAIVTVVAAGVVLFLMLMVIPQFTKLFQQFGQELPLPTQIVIGTSDFIGNNIFNLIALLVGGGIALYQINQSDRGKRFFDTIKLTMPLFGSLVQKYNIAMFSRNLATLFQSGVTIINGMKISIEVVENVVLQEALVKVIREVEGGQPIARALERAEVSLDSSIEFRIFQVIFFPLFLFGPSKINVMPELTTQMIEVGEESGNLDEMLERVAEFYEDEINFLIDQLASLIEPAFIIVLGSIVGTIVLAMYLPIFRMARVVSGGASNTSASGMAGGAP